MVIDMCTAIHYNSFFGRNLDLEISYNERVVITPRNYSFKFKNVPDVTSHYAMIGMGIVVDDYPLYYDAVNEKGLSVAGLNFPDNAHYMPPILNKTNIAPFELIPYILGKCSTINEVKSVLLKLNIVKINFNSDYPLSPLHWMFADKKSSIVVEPLKDGVNIYENPIGVLTNNPPFSYHLTNLINYMGISSKQPENLFSDKITLSPYSRGMGGIGIPGDLSSASRFIKAAFTLLNSPRFKDENEEISQFFHILTSVEQQKGCVHVMNKYEFTLYSSCCDMDKAIYYYTTYNNRSISSVHLFNENLETTHLITYPLCDKLQINSIN